MRNIRIVSGLLVTFLALSNLCCDELLEVDLPSRVPESALNDPANAALLVRSAVSDFECAFSNYIVATGMLVDELYSSGLNNPNFWGRRLITPTDPSHTAQCGQQDITPFNIAVYTPLSIARFTADAALRRIEAFPDSLVANKNQLIATAAAYAGFAYTLFGEGFCRAAFDLGPALAPKDVLAIAELRFSEAIELEGHGANDSIVNFARVGRARVRLDLGKRAEAREDARRVPAGFVKYATYISNPLRRKNTVWLLNQGVRVASVDTAFRNLSVAGVPDPRVRVIDARRRGHDGITPLWHQTKYPTDSSPIPIASWNEAQLIIAEVEGGQSAVNRINELRTKAGLPHFSSSEEAVIAKQVLEERRRELFLDGHRIGDFIRLGIPFETGVTHKNQSYGNTTCIDLPQVEIDNNPNLRMQRFSTSTVTNR